ncbi:MAG TPA: ATP synthase F0 subunit B [Candidatus Rubrimentiphilum sp.]|nr:ATP synthase F0 subunit B [Candidatus Rubrimentiphilum sp.]
MFLSLDGTFFIQLLNFAIFFAILNLVFMRPVARAITKRREYINSVTSDYDRYQAEGNALRAQAESIRAAARREAEQLAAKVRAETSNESADVSAKFAQQASEAIQHAERTVEAELAAARSHDKRTIDELADEIFARAVPEIAR